MVDHVTLDDITERLGARIEDALKSSVVGQGTMFDALAYHLAAGGKRLRALIPPWVAASLGGVAEDAVDLGVAVELVHNGTLVHDDVQDGDEVRRGQPAVWTQFGLPQAINVGSWMMFAGCARALRAPVGPSVVGDLQRAVIRVIEGQALEFDLQRAPDPSPARWETMARAKTGALFSVAYRMGALAAGHTSSTADGLAAYGEALGLFFQLQDDLLDLLGDKGRGTYATDIEEGKISFPVAWAAELGHPDERARLLALVHAPRGETTRAMVDEALALLRATGAIDASLTRLRHLAAELGQSQWSFATPGLVERVLMPLGHVL